MSGRLGRQSPLGDWSRSWLQLFGEWSKEMGTPAASLTVLLVDDDDLIQRAGQALLGALGHRVTLAKNGQQAIEMLETHSFDAVLLDLTMPVMSGKEAFIEIRRRWPNLVVAICTGYFVDIQQWLSSPEDAPPHILQKPYSVAELSEFLSAAASKAALP